MCQNLHRTETVPLQQSQTYQHTEGNSTRSVRTYSAMLIDSYTGES